MIYRVVPFAVTFSDRLSRFQGHGITTDALDVLCAQLTHGLFEIAKFLVIFIFFCDGCNEVGGNYAN